MINRELKHRIKNLFSIANSICLQTIKPGKSAEEMSKAVTGRIMAIAAAQDLLSVTASEGAELRELVTALVTPLAPDPSRLEVGGPAMRLPADTTTPFALILSRTRDERAEIWRVVPGCGLDQAKLGHGVCRTEFSVA